MIRWLCCLILLTGCTTHPALAPEPTIYGSWSGWATVPGQATHLWPMRLVLAPEFVRLWIGDTEVSRETIRVREVTAESVSLDLIGGDGAPYMSLRGSRSGETISGIGGPPNVKAWEWRVTRGESSQHMEGTR